MPLQLDPTKCPPPRLAPKRKSNGGAQAELKQRLLLPMLNSVFDSDQPLTAEAILAAAGLSDADRWLTTVVTGAGINSLGGLNLWKDSSSRVLCCYDNAALLWSQATEQQQQRFLDDRGWTFDEFQTELLGLPKLDG